MNSNNITKNFIAAVKDRLTSDKWSVFDVNFTGKCVPCSSEEVRVHIKLDGNGCYLYGVNGYYDEPQNLISEQEFGDLMKDITLTTTRSVTSMIGTSHLLLCLSYITMGSTFYRHI